MGRQDEEEIDVIVLAMDSHTNPLSYLMKEAQRLVVMSREVAMTERRGQSSETFRDIPVQKRTEAGETIA